MASNANLISMPLDEVKYLLVDYADDDYLVRNIIDEFYKPKNNELSQLELLELCRRTGYFHCYSNNKKTATSTKENDGRINADKYCDVMINSFKLLEYENFNKDFKVLNFSNLEYEILEDLIKIFITKCLIDMSLSLNSLSVAIELNQMMIFNISELLSFFNTLKFGLEVSSMRNSKVAQERWKPHNEKRKQLKERYLSIMQNKENPFHTITGAAEHIFQYENPEKKKYRWIYDRLTEATKGNFD